MRFHGIFSTKKVLWQYHGTVSNGNTMVVKEIPWFKKKKCVNTNCSQYGLSWHFYVFKHSTVVLLFVIMVIRIFTKAILTFVDMYYSSTMVFFEVRKV